MPIGRVTPAVARLRGSAVREWLAFAIVAAIASYFIAPAATPIDRALPLFVLLISICGLVAERFPALFQIATLLLFAPAIFLAHEHTRLLGYGVIAAAAFAFSLAIAPQTLHAAVTLTIAGVLLLRWIPFSPAMVWRELIVMIGAVVLVTAVGLKPAPTLGIALVTPIFPAKMLLFPFVVAVLLLLPIPRLAMAGALAVFAYYARYSVMILCVVTMVALLWDERRLLNAPAYAAAIALFALWPWSGILARAFPAILFAEPASPSSRPVWVALPHGRAFTMDVPHNVTITATGANAAALPPGRIMGSVDNRTIAIGDVADFGFMRREHFFSSRNRPPRTPLADIHDFGAAAWLHTAGRIRFATPAGALRVTAAPDLPPGTKLQIEAVEFE